MKTETKLMKQVNFFETANSTLLAPSGLDTNALQGVLSNILTHNIDYADLYFQYSRAESWSHE